MEGAEENLRKMTERSTYRCLNLYGTEYCKMYIYYVIRTRSSTCMYNASMHISTCMYKYILEVNVVLLL